MSVRRIVGIVFVRNEDIFVEQAVRNIAEFCDGIGRVRARHMWGTVQRSGAHGASAKAVRPTFPMSLEPNRTSPSPQDFECSL